MKPAQIELELFKKEDANGKTYFVAPFDIPANIDLNDFLVFIWPNLGPNDDEVPILRLRPKEQNDAADDGYGNRREGNRRDKGTNPYKEQLR